ncbi:MAG: hypothetical protein HY298_21020 [Verrucomicrobia bacterium]|nr:hypothetical protein [Verrucomicrobiota bacterium]
MSSENLKLERDIRAILVCSSHWDREWYWHFQAYREKLVRLLDDITNRLSTEADLPFFQMDGQFVPIEDYLEIRPERRELVERLVRDGKLQVGPWYTLPDLFLISGESLVRNLHMGMLRSRHMGRTAQVGFVADMFGHNRQMPQIFSLFGLRPAFVWRGLNAGEQPANFAWESPDGSRVDTYRFGSSVGYAEYAITVRRAFEPATAFDFSRTVDDAIGLIQSTSRRTDAKTILLFDGGDHLEFFPETLALVKEINVRAGCELVRLGTLDDYAAAIENDPAARRHVLRGELRKTAKVGEETCLIHGVGSSRIPLKQTNHACETLLTLWAEPWAAMAQQCLGMAYPYRAFDLAWQYLLQNHPHDSICGCSVDKVHDGMLYRFAQTQELAEAHLNQIFHAFSQATLQPRISADEIGFTVFTAAGTEESNQPEVEFLLPTEWPKFTDEFFEYERKPSFRVFDMDGHEISYQLVSLIPKHVYPRIHRGKFPYSEARQKVRICLDCKLAPFSVTPFIVRRDDKPARHKGTNLRVDTTTLRNEWLEVQVEPNGTLRLRDLQTDQVYSGLLTLEDSADIGDGWYRGTALQDEIYFSTGCHCSVSVRNPGPLQARLQVDLTWELPASFDLNSMRRGADRAVMRVRHELVLRKDSRWVEIETTVENTIKDHRLRLLFPSGLQNVAEYTADAPFDAVARPIGLPEDNHLRKELAVEGTPQQNWIAVSDGNRGLAVIAPGQYESAVLDQASRPISITLLRAFRRAFMTEGNEGGQIQGTQRFRMALMPIGGIEPARLQRIAQTLSSKPRACQSEIRDFDTAYELRSPITNSLFEIRGNIVFSALLYDQEGRLLLRLYNPAASQEKVQLTTALPVCSWQVVDLDHRVLGPEQKLEEPFIEFSLGPWKIQTLRLRLRTTVASSPPIHLNEKVNTQRKNSYERHACSS